MKEEEKSEVVGHVTKALTDHFNAHHRLAIHHFAEGSEEESEAEEEEMETDSPSKPDSMPAVDTSNLQLAWEMLELAKVKSFICFTRLLYHVVGDLREEGQGCGSGEEEGGAGSSLGSNLWPWRGNLPSFIFIFKVAV